MKKVLSILLVVLLLISVLPSVVLADNVPEYRYTDWRYNNDFTKVTINGKTYDNYVIVYRIGNELWLNNVGADYLTDASLQEQMTPDEYFSKIKEEVKKNLTSGEDKYPFTEIIYINYRPWQEYPEFKSFLMGEFEKYYDHYHSSLAPKDKLFAFLEDASNNGYAYEVFKNKKSIEEAKKAMPLDKMKIAAGRWMLYKTYAEFKESGYQIFGEEIGETSLIAMLNRMKQPRPVLGGEPDPIKTAETVIVLYLNKKNVTITKNGVTSNVTLDVSPYCPRGTTLIPLRGVMEAFGAEVKWLPDTRQVKVTKDNMTIFLTIGSKIALVNGKQVTMLEPAQIVNGRTLIPLRFVSENLGYTVKWDGSTQKITIFK